MPGTRRRAGIVNRCDYRAFEFYEAKARTDPPLADSIDEGTVLQIAA